jgi:sirohydrochlorin cobaltochelatase
VSDLSVNEGLLLIGHGSVRYPDAGDAMRRHADTLRGSGRFAQVAVAVLNGAPSVDDALGRMGEGTIRVVPFFMEDGYFSRVAVPRAVAVAARSVAVAARSVVMCPPVGVHDGMAGLIERQAQAGCGVLGIASHAVAVLVVGHGSSRSPGRALALHRHAARVAATGLFARVEAACLEESPLVASALAGLRAHPVVVIGFFANQGGHVRDDVPGAVAAEQAVRGLGGAAVRFQGCVADDPMMTGIILDQADHGRGGA